MPGTLMGRAHAFERGEKLYITTPLTISRPTDQQIEEFAFASAVKSKAPNDNIGWLHGHYVEAGRANLNGAMWLSDELAIKALTPMLMPVTVMHDPSTAVGVIADTKFDDSQTTPRIDTTLAIWKHRFPAEWEEAAINIDQGTMAQSMECFAPHYSCADCGQTWVKLPHGNERASWCSHLNSEGGRRILGDVCFTGTGLIYGTRGGVGAYTDAQLDYFREEVAEYHDRAHHDSSSSPRPRSDNVTLVQIEDTELATLRSERNEAREKVDRLTAEARTLQTAVETAEAAKVRAETEKADAEKKFSDAEEKAQKAVLKDQRISALGAGFLAALGDTSKARLNELAMTCTPEQWNVELSEREEIAKVKRDAAAAGTPAATDPPAVGTGFKDEEVASFLSKAAPTAPATAGPVSGDSAVKALARSFDKRRPAPANA